MELPDVHCLLTVFILFFTCICTPASSQQMSWRHDEEVSCDSWDCLMGTCKATPGSGLGIDCDCYSGWTKPTILNFTLPICVLPHCTLKFQCHGKHTRLPLPSTFPFPPSINLTAPPACVLTWCGEGECVAHRKTHKCNCHKGSANLLSSAALPCVRKDCNLAVDCSKVTTIPPVTSVSSPSEPLPNSSQPPPSAPSRSGSADAPNFLRDYQALSWMHFVVIVILWI